MNVKSTVNLLERLKPLPFFSIASVRQLSRSLSLAEDSVNTYVSRFLLRKEIFPLKNGLYVSEDFVNKNKSDISYLFYLANVIRKPSYISSYTALQYYNLATEAVYNVASVTIKVTRSYDTRLGSFFYRSIKKELFSDFSLKKGDPGSPSRRFDFFIASPAKALFDLLYFKMRQFRNAKMEEVIRAVKESRIDLEEMSSDDQSKFFEMVRKAIEL